MNYNIMKKQYKFDQDFYTKTRNFFSVIDSIMKEYEQKEMRISIRQLYYQAVSRLIIKNNKANYNGFVEKIKNGRLYGFLDWELLEDRTRYLRENLHWDSPAEILNACVRSYHLDLRSTQQNYIECWIEKDSLIELLQDTCKPLDIPCFSCRGFSSVTALYEAKKRFEHSGRKNYLLYAGDFDPSGLEISESIKNYLHNIFKVDVEIRRLGITLNQAKELKLPAMPAKEKDANYKSFIK